jgi:aryl-alcohol dehydrogenase-like predicted oxidoreductase
VEYVSFGRAGIKVSRLALGLGLRGQSDETAAEQLTYAALDSGINLFDCANVYGLMDDRAYAGRSEVILGRALKRRRDEVVITSKVCSAIGNGPNDAGGSRYHIMREVERSLRRLATDRIDIYLLHTFDASTPLEEQLRALDDLVRQGKVRYVGVCNYAAWQVCQALWVQDHMAAAPLLTVQNPYSLLNRDLEREMFPLVRALGIGVMAYAPLGTGLLSGAYRPGVAPSPETLWGGSRRPSYERTLRGAVADVATTLQQVAERCEATIAQVALRWVLSHPEVTVAISGADTAVQMRENVGALNIEIAPDDLVRLSQVSAGLDLILDGPGIGSSSASQR